MLSETEIFTALCRAIETIAVRLFNEAPKEEGGLWYEHTWDDLVGSSRSIWRRKACESLKVDYDLWLATYKEMCSCDSFVPPFLESSSVV